MKYILSIDQGTSSTRSVIFDENANIISSSQTEIKQYYPKDGWVEHDPIEIWNTVQSTMGKAIKNSKIDISEISAIGITNQRETIVAWNKKTGIPLGKAIVWQCRRTSRKIEELKKENLMETFHKKTGLILDAYFSGTKIQWILENNSDILKARKNNQLAFGTIDSWLIFKLTGEFKTDASNASRTLLYNINKKEWDDELLEILNIEKSTLPLVQSNLSDPFGYYKKQGVNVPVTGVLGDQQAALFGQAAFNKGQNKTTYGTGNFVLLNIGNNINLSKNGLLTTVAYELDNKITYALEGSVFITGAAFKWLRDGIGLIKDYREIDELAALEKDSNGVYFVPAFVGLGAPYWDSSARGSIFGITASTNRSNIIHAALDAVAFQTEELFNTLKKDSGYPIKKMRVDGGISKSDILLQKQSDISQMTIDRSQIAETTALGAAFIAGLGTIWDSLDDFKNIRKSDKLFFPQASTRENDYKLNKWEDAISRSRNWIKV